MAGLAKGMATTSGCTLVLCDCRNLIHQVRQRRFSRARRRWRLQHVHGVCDVQDRTRASIAFDACNGNIFFPVCGCSCAQDRRAPKGSMREPTTFKLQEYHETTCVSDRQPDHQLPDPKSVCGCEIQVQVTTMMVFLPGDIIGAEGGKADPRDATKRSCPD
jgi:hypothetical protein